MLVCVCVLSLVGMCFGEVEPRLAKMTHFMVFMLF
jgi:hypothetical protein